jgi:mono/diheme cytochrome c family protein
VLRNVDRVLAVATYVVAGLFVLMLLVGPKLVAEDKPDPGAEAAGAAPYAGGDRGGGSADGKQVFTDNCGSCHTLEKAGTTGAVGPNLDEVDLSPGTVEQIVRGGAGVMPAFEGKLSDEEIAAVAAYVGGTD